MHHTIIIDRAGLIWQSIPITADSTAALGTHAGGYNDYAALLVDGRWYDLVMAKHVVGRPEIIAALTEALADVQAAIDGVGTPPTPTPVDRSKTTLRTVQCPTCGYHYFADTCRAENPCTRCGSLPAAPPTPPLAPTASPDPAAPTAAPALPPTDLTIPPVADILALVKERYDAARLHDDYPGAGQLDRVRRSLDRGAALSWSYGDLLIQSVNNPGSVYSVNRAGCTCPNGRAGRSSCWHVCLFDLLLDMRQTAADSADIEAKQGEDDGDGGPPVPPTPITVSTTPGGLAFTRHGVT